MHTNYGHFNKVQETRRYESNNYSKTLTDLRTWYSEDIEMKQNTMEHHQNLKQRPN